MRFDLRRATIVALALAGVGAVVGAVLGVGLATAIMIPTNGPLGASLLREAVAIAARYGAAVGAILAPIAAFTLMRRVPIWRAITETAIGTVVGAGAGMLLQPALHLAVLSPALLGVVGFAAAAVRLRLANRKQPALVAPGEVNSLSP